MGRGRRCNRGHSAICYSTSSSTSTLSSSFSLSSSSLPKSFTLSFPKLLYFKEYLQHARFSKVQIFQRIFLARQVFQNSNISKASTPRQSYAAQVIDRILFTQGPNLLIRASWCYVYTPSNVLPPMYYVYTSSNVLLRLSYHIMLLHFPTLLYASSLIQSTVPHIGFTINNSQS